MLDTPLTTWFPRGSSLQSFRERVLGRRPVVLGPRNRAWRAIAPGFRESLAMARSGLPFQIVADRRYDRSGSPGRLPRAMATGATVFLPQVHQVLPRLTRLMVALRMAFLGPFREEASFLFLVNGVGRRGMGLHHDGEVDAFWLQLEGRRTVSLGPPVPRGTPENLHGGPPHGDRRWATFDLRPGTLLYMPPRTPHEVVCHARSLALSLTWGHASRRRRTARARAESLVAWDVASGHVSAMPRARRDRLWTQIPVLIGPARPAARTVTVWTPDGALACPAVVRALARQLPAMPTLRRRRGVHSAAWSPLIEAGILAPTDLPLRILPDDPGALDGWRFA